MAGRTTVDVWESFFVQGKSTDITYAFNGGYVESAVLHHNCLNNQDAN